MLTPVYITYCFVFETQYDIMFLSVSVGDIFDVIITEFRNA